MISKKSSSLHVVIRQSIWEEVRIFQEVRSDKQLTSHDIKLKDVSAVKDSLDHTSTIASALQWASVQIVGRLIRWREWIAARDIQEKMNRHVFVFVATTEQYVVTTEFNR